MNNTRVRSELFDSLDYLIPPVKKDHITPDKDFKPTDYLLRDFRRNIFVKSSPCTSDDLNDQTCSSLFLKKTTKQFIQEQYSILNVDKCKPISNLCCQNKIHRTNSVLKEERPTIKVTVIPKSKETPTSKVFDKRCQNSSQVQPSHSNQENFKKNQNVYLLIKDKKKKKRAKFHELKTSESVNLSSRDVNEKYGNISFRKISDSKQLLQSLNMDKKKRSKRKDIKKQKSVKTLVSDNCNYQEGFRDKISNINDHKSRVTVVGQLGLNQKDCYVFKYATTMNDESLETNDMRDNYHDNFSRFSRNFIVNQNQYTSSTGCNVNNCEFLRQNRHQDSIVQTDFSYPHFLEDTSMIRNRVANQSTQVNFNFPNQIPTNNFKNQTAQCYCTLSTTPTALDTDAGDIELKGCKSPLVVISVYPKQDIAVDKDTVKIIRHTSPGRKETANIIRNKITQDNLRESSPERTIRTKLTKMESKLTRSRSSSPKTKHGSKKGFENKSESRERNHITFKKGSPRKVGSPNLNVINNIKEYSSCQCSVKPLETKILEQNEIKTTKTRDAEQVKKALVNSFLQNVNVMDRNNRKSKLLPPKDDASKVTINIDGENERYDVLLEHSSYDTGVSVRKITKVPKTDAIEEDKQTKSLEKVLTLSGEFRGKNDYSQHTRRAQPPHDVVKKKPTGPRLNIKDSIEICRRQGMHSNHNFRSCIKNDKSNSAEASFNTDFFAPVKHYPGDNCSISDPNERDREIRELLGVERIQRRQDTLTRDTHSYKHDGCCCRKCSTGTGLSMTKFLSNKYLKRTNKKEQQNKICQSGSLYLEEKNIDNYSLTKTNQSKLNIFEELNVTEKPHYHIPDTPENVVNAMFKSAMAQTAEDTFKRNVCMKNDIAASVKSRFQHHENTLKRDSKINSNVPHKNDAMLSQNLILNRNVQIFLQLEQFSRKRPVLLTRKQYEKVKKILECKTSKKLSIEKRKRSNLKNNVVSVGEIKVKPRLQPASRTHHEIQTDRSEVKIQESCKPHKCKIENSLPINKDAIVHQEVNNVLVDCATLKEKENIEGKSTRQTVSSMEIRYAKLEYKKCITISSSSTRFNNEVMDSLYNKNAKRNSNSVLTIFKGHKKSVTPNLGTSSFSLSSDVTDLSYKTHKQPQCAGDCKPKKPFLQQLISCLVMHSNETSNAFVKKPTIPTFNSSDSYHLSTSLGALEMTSSLYDTSASFYSNHTILPVNKIKKGFFRSVREFLRRT